MPSTDPMEESKEEKPFTLPQIGNTSNVRHQQPVHILPSIQGSSLNGNTRRAFLKSSQKNLPTNPSFPPPIPGQRVGGRLKFPSILASDSSPVILTPEQRKKLDEDHLRTQQANLNVPQQDIMIQAELAHLTEFCSHEKDLLEKHREFLTSSLHSEQEKKDNAKQFHDDMKNLLMKKSRALGYIMKGHGLNESFVSFFFIFMIIICFLIINLFFLMFKESFHLLFWKIQVNLN